MATPQANGGVVALQGALQAATAAAEAATAALAEIKQSKVSGLVSKPKELELTGKPEADIGDFGRTGDSQQPST